MNSVFQFFKYLIEDKNEYHILDKLRVSDIVIESTSRCNLKCTMCPRKSFLQLIGDMDIDLFNKISKYLNSAHTVNLSGWGEPLLHPKLIEMIQIAKKKGVRIGFTTNATLLDKKMSEKIIKSGLNFIDFSIDGATQATYEQIRLGSNFNDVIDNINNFIKVKEKLHINTLSTSITFVMMKQNIHELPQMVLLAKELGIDILVAKNFNVITNEDDIEQIVFSQKNFIDLDSTFIQYRDKIAEDCISLAKKMGLDFVIHSFKPDKSKKCNLALKGLFISHTGEVTICCATGYPVPRMLNKNDILINASKIYGNINKNKLSNILQIKKYIDCRTKAAKGIIPVECDGCLLSEGL